MKNTKRGWNSEIVFWYREHVRYRELIWKLAKRLSWKRIFGTNVWSESSYATNKFCEAMDIRRLDVDWRNLPKEMRTIKSSSWEDAKRLYGYKQEVANG